jgi:hypothetical protein
MRERQLSGDCALVIIVPHQGDHEWAVVFDDGEDDARVYVRWEAEDGETWLLTAPDVGMFFWDLAQTGLTWYSDTKFKGGKPVRRSDIGLVLYKQTRLALLLWLLALALTGVIGFGVYLFMQGRLQLPDLRSPTSSPPQSEVPPSPLPQTEVRSLPHNAIVIL